MNPPHLVEVMQPRRALASSPPHPPQVVVVVLLRSTPAICTFFDPTPFWNVRAATKILVDSLPIPSADIFARATRAIAMRSFFTSDGTSVGLEPTSNAICATSLVT